MNEYLASAIILAGYGILSYAANLIIRKSNPVVVGITVALYFVATYAYFEEILKLHYYLRDRGFYIDFGHAELLLIMLFFFCIIIAVINCIVAGLYRNIK